MQTRTYGDLFSLITNMIGAVELAADEQTQVKNFINRRFQEAFDTSDVWPRYLVSSEERNLVSFVITGTDGTAGLGVDATLINQNYVLLGTGNGSGAEASGTLVYSGLTNAVIIYNSGSAWTIDQLASAAKQSDGTYVVTTNVPPEFLETDTNKKDNVLDVETWTRQGGSGTTGPTLTGKNLVPYAQSGKNTIGDFNRIHRKKAFLNNSAIEYDFFADADGANILNIVNTTDNTAFVTYKKQFTPFTVVSDFYNSTAEVPAEFFNYMAHAVYADFLRVQNKQEEAIAEENVAAKYLAQELEKVDIRMNNSTINKRFSTYVNRQSR